MEKGKLFVYLKGKVQSEPGTFPWDLKYRMRAKFRGKSEVGRSKVAEGKEPLRIVYYIR